MSCVRGEKMGTPTEFGPTIYFGNEYFDNDFFDGIMIEI